MTFPTAAKILLFGGLGLIAYGFVLGFSISSIRMRAPAASRHLITAHLAAIIQGSMLVALSSAIVLTDVRSDAAATSAGSLLAGCALFVAGATVNWLRGAGDHFAERTVGWKLLAVSAPLNIVGLIGLGLGVVRAMT